ncbi:MAG: phenylacetate--CoA ligase family protein, partial [Desulfosarcina sp.]
GTGIECREHDCIHYWGDYYLVEILDPATLEPLPDGEWGEMVVTSLCKEGAPLIRYRTRDITRIIPGRCRCGSILPRHFLLFRVIKAAFGKRRKTLRNALSQSDLELVPGASERLLEKALIDPMRRAESLSVAEFVRLSNEIGTHRKRIEAGG